MLRKILILFVPVYYVVTWLRNCFYDKGILNSKSYDFPVVCVGNLSVGGTGKTPMIEYLIRILQDHKKVAVLSRGYKRKSKGFHLAKKSTTVEDIGDEPYQFHSKFNNINVAVDSDRQNGIAKLQKQVNPEIVLLDDAFQHRKVKAGFYILLTTFDNLFVNDILLPTGNLREPRKGANRADVIIITKCPKDISESQKEEVIKAINPKKNQTIYFSYIEYSENLKSLTSKQGLESLKEQPFTLVTGIANATPLVNFLNSQDFKYEHLHFGDHHDFTPTEIELLKAKDFVLTTEKDFMRLRTRMNSNLYYISIEVKLDKPTEFETTIKNYLKSVRQ